MASANCAAEMGASPISLRNLLCLAIAALPACATSAGVLNSNRMAVSPTPSERAMLEDFKDGKLDRLSELEAALIVGGTRDPGELAAAARTLDAALNRAVQESDPRGMRENAWIASVDAPRRGRALLFALFAERDGRRLLQTYDASSTTLYDVVTTGRFNCVSATTLYLLAAHRARIDARPVLLPSHARAVVVAGERNFVVETTNPYGFDPPAAVLEQTRDRGRPQAHGDSVDLYADERGTEVSFAALLAATYGNISILSYEEGDTVLTTALLAREAALTPPEALPVVRMQQMSLLTELATHAFREGNLDRAMRFARRAFEVADGADGKRMAEQNIAAIAVRHLNAHQAQYDDARLTTYAQPLSTYPNAYGDVQAAALTILGRRRMKRGDVDGGAAALRQAADVAASGNMRARTQRNATLGELNRLGKLSESDAETAWTEWKKLGQPPAELSAQHQRIGALIAQNRSLQLSNDGRCEELETALAEAGGFTKAETLRASCHARRAQRDLRAAAKQTPE